MEAGIRVLLMRLPTCLKAWQIWQMWRLWWHRINRAAGSQLPLLPSRASRSIVRCVTSVSEVLSAHTSLAGLLLCMALEHMRALAGIISVETMLKASWALFHACMWHGTQLHGAPVSGPAGGGLHS
jgi:hypothetical protein